MLKNDECFWVIEYRWPKIPNFNKWKYLVGSTHVEFFAAEKELIVLHEKWRGEPIEFRSAKYGPVNPDFCPTISSRQDIDMWLEFSEKVHAKGQCDNLRMCPVCNKWEDPDLDPKSE